MDIRPNRNLSLCLYNEEIDTLRHICELAYKQLHSKPETQMHGSPLTKQSGLYGPELHHVKKMLEQIGDASGVDLPIEPSSQSQIENPRYALTT